MPGALLYQGRLRHIPTPQAPKQLRESQQLSSLCSLVPAPLDEPSSEGAQHPGPHTQCHGDLPTSHAHSSTLGGQMLLPIWAFLSALPIPLNTHVLLCAGSYPPHLLYQPIFREPHVWPLRGAGHHAPHLNLLVNIVQCPTLGPG